MHDEIKRLKFNLNSLEKFSNNLNANGTMVHPTIKTLKSFNLYYINKTGSYAKIADYCQELSKMFLKKGRHFTTLAIFKNPTYQPKKSEIKIGVLKKNEMKINEKYKSVVKQMSFYPGKVIAHTHNGSNRLLSLFWKELTKYCEINNIKVRRGVSHFEIYHKVNKDPSKQIFEIFIPIK